MAASGGARRRTRGEVETLPSGGLRVRVYAGSDPLTGRRHYLVETVPAGRTAARDAEKVRSRLLNEVDQRRNPTTKATMNQLFDKWLDIAELEGTTRASYVSKLDRHIRPALGQVQVGRLDSETLEGFYGSLRRCRDRCDGRRQARRADAHMCRPLAPATVRQIHAIIAAALGRAVRWRWLAVSPAVSAVAPAAPTPDPRPPTADQAARILTEAWKDADWGTLVWLAATTGARRAELCALRWSNVDLATGTLEIRASIGQVGPETWEKDTKTHQQRRIALDDQTVRVLQAHQDRASAVASSLGVVLAAGAFVFSAAPDGSTWLRPDSVGQRYQRMCARIGIGTHLHQLRHFSATELIAAGVDVRTVAGRLGHGGGGTTTLKVYSAWRSEVDQRAANKAGLRMPAPPASMAPVDVMSPESLEQDDPSPYRRIAADLCGAIRCGALRSGDHVPTLVELAAQYDVAVGTAHRAVALLNEAGVVSAGRGRRTTVA